MAIEITTTIMDKIIEEPPEDRKKEEIDRVVTEEVVMVVVMGEEISETTGTRMEEKGTEAIGTEIKARKVVEVVTGETEMMAIEEATEAEEEVGKEAVMEEEETTETGMIEEAITEEAETASGTEEIDRTADKRSKTRN